MREARDLVALEVDVLPPLVSMAATGFESVGITTGKRPRAFIAEGGQSAVSAANAPSFEVGGDTGGVGRIKVATKPSRRKSCEHPSCPKQPAFS